MKNIKLIIFDLDGTLADAYRPIIASFNYVMQKLRLRQRSSLVIRRAVGWGDENLLAPFVGPAQLKEAVSLYRRHHQKSLLRGSVLLPGAKKLLNRLKRKKYLLAIASNRPTKFTRILIRHLGLERYFDYVLCADKVKRGKPYPDILNAIRKRFFLSRQEALYVGDMTIDAQAAANAGVRCVIVTGGSSSRAQIRKARPWRIISQVAGLSKLLQAE